MSTFHLVKVHFDRRRADIDQAWLDNRYEFFRAHTLRSLEAQTLDDFRLWFCCEPGMESMVAGLRDVTCNGQRPVFSYLSPAPRMGEHVVNFLPPVDKLILRSSEYVYVTRIDSDDLYSRDALQLAHDCRPIQPGRIEASMFARGYMHDLRSGRVGTYTNPSSPFHTLMFPTRAFADEAAYNLLPIGDHSVVRSKWPCQTLAQWKFTVLIHGNNFLSDMDYSNEVGSPVEKDWSIERFVAQPVVFDLDDFCDQYDCIDELCQLKAVYPGFKATLFTIPERTSARTLNRIDRLLESSGEKWIELAVHGVCHEPNLEMKGMVRERFTNSLDKIFRMSEGNIRLGRPSAYVRGFRPPGWWLDVKTVDVCNEYGMWVAVHLRDQASLGSLCRHGHYVCDSRPYWHGHTHDVCGNWVRKHLPQLKGMWRRDQAFAFVSESLLRY